MFTFATDYFLLSTVATVGVIQISASMGRLNGLLLFKSHLAARLLGLMMIVAAFVWFFSTGDRNINDYEGGLDANTQALFFFLGVMSGGAITFVISSLVNFRKSGGPHEPGGGLNALKDSSYFRALTESIKYWWKNWRSQMKRYFFG